MNDQERTALTETRELYLPRILPLIRIAAQR